VTLGGLLWDLKGYFVAGGIILTIGIAVYLAGRSAGSSASTTRWISLPLLGCGGCLFIYPLFMVFGALALGYGIAAFCERQAAC